MLSTAGVEVWVVIPHGTKSGCSKVEQVASTACVGVRLVLCCGARLELLCEIVILGGQTVPQRRVSL